MNVIENIKTDGRRLYITISLDGIKEIVLKFYNPYDHSYDVIKTIKKAINFKDFADNKNYEDGHGNLVEKYPHEELIDCITKFIDGTRYKNLGVTGVYDEQVFKDSKIKLTELGKKKFAVYFHMGLGADPLEFGFSKEEAQQKMLQWKLGTLTWNGKQKKSSSTDVDRMYTHKLEGETVKYLDSIDSIEELVKYKNLSEDNIQNLINAGLIEGIVKEIKIDIPKASIAEQCLN